MDIPRLDPKDTALLIIDVQERLIPTLPKPEALVTNCLALVRMAQTLGLPALVTEQYPRGLGKTVPEIASDLGSDIPVIEKTRFSALVPEVRQRLDDLGRGTVLVCGIEAHICVLQTVLDLQASGRQAFAATDAISAGQPNQMSPAFHRMQRAGAVLTGVLSSMYELMADKQHPAFLPCLHIAKTVQS